MAELHLLLLPNFIVIEGTVQAVKFVFIAAYS
jgi:hypothetical protein